jgi:6-pyruvoyltetrahydropterin/6-carboxytetrahydropterin synthase
MGKKFISTKVYDGYSTCFRQWRAEGTHCKFLHGYGVSFKVWFEGELDEKNWVFDFGGFKRAKTTIEGRTPKDYFNWLLDHTTIIADDDPKLMEFQKLHDLGLIQMRVLPEVGCEVFARHIYEILTDFVTKETDGRVEIKQVEFREHGKNSAIYSEEE